MPAHPHTRAEIQTDLQAGWLYLSVVRDTGKYWSESLTKLLCIALLLAAMRIDICRSKKQGAEGCERTGFSTNTQEDAIDIHRKPGVRLLDVRQKVTRY